MISRRTRWRVARRWRAWRLDLVAVMVGAVAIYLLVLAVHG